jgi:hypothetical protein
MVMLVTSRSSSAWRAMVRCTGVFPIDRMISRYWPPPSGKSRV